MISNPKALFFLVAAALGATASAECPAEQPAMSAPCNFEGECPYNIVTCCDGSKHTTITSYCFENSTFNAFLADGCAFINCDPPEPCPVEKPFQGSNCNFEEVCAYDKVECCDGSSYYQTHVSCANRRARVAGLSNPTFCDAAVCPTAKATKKGSGSGDPHFKTWTGEKYDYHGECDLVLVDNPKFADGKGLRVHIRTTRVKYFSFIEKIGLQIGEDVLEFENDADTFWINGEQVPPNRRNHKTYFAGYLVRRDPKAISVRLTNGRGDKTAKIDLHTRKNGFPAVIVQGGDTDLFAGSLGLLGDWSTGAKLARDGKTVLDDEDATEFALEWQVRDTEPMLFREPRYPQFPVQCTPPAKVPGGRLGLARAREEAEEACSHWKEDKEDCIFDVIATQDTSVATEGHLERLE